MHVCIGALGCSRRRVCCSGAHACVPARVDFCAVARCAEVVFVIKCHVLCTGLFSHGGLARMCSKCTLCADIDAYQTGSCTLEQDTGCKTCAACPSGKWAKSACTGAGIVHCAAHTKCPTGSFLIKAGTASGGARAASHERGGVPSTATCWFVLHIC